MFTLQKRKVISTPDIPNPDLDAAIESTCSYLRRIPEDDELRAKFMATPKDLHEYIRVMAEMKELCGEDGDSRSAGGVIILPATEE